MNRTRIVCTIGPRSLPEPALLALREAGMNVARLNGSHADLDWHRHAIAEVRRVLPEVPILLDIPGRKIRTTQLEHEPSFELGDEIILTTEPDHDGSAKVPVNYPDLHTDLEAGHIVLADDGTLRFTVLRVDGRDIVCRAETAGQLRSRKGINVPFVKLNTPSVTPRDEAMIAFARETGVDFIGLSFVESADQIRQFRDLIGETSPRIVAKVENQGGMDNVQEIAEAADAIMVDRGDLSVETSLHDVALRQKRIIEAARRHGRPVIIATEMLHTMIQNSFPTKAEVSDISNAVLDGCAATMLSGETAIGDFPEEAVRLMREVSEAAETHAQDLLDADAPEIGDSVPEVMSRVIPMMCRALPITRIVAITRSGFAARMIAAGRPRQPIIAVSDDIAAARSFNLIAGTMGVHSNVPFPKSSMDHFGLVLEMLWQRNFLDESDLVLTTGVTYPYPGNRMNSVQVNRISELVASLGWERASE
ncbi:MAG: pyruvate kinase [Alphaproteobacteria bacterium]|nr:pyruvate kinase [Alphaproteobacteria bacterium]|tara:strand:- start:1156 stop:2589 length:1434 start_codon:yes stop_codon:yes gene_type:complete